MKITFLGTNGWYSDKLGNTPSTLIEGEDCYVIFDAGYGIAEATKFIKKDKPAYLFLSHMHLDHVCGLHVLPKFNFKQGLLVISTAKMYKDFKKITNHPFMSPLENMKYPAKYQVAKIGHNIKSIEFDCLPLKHVDHTVGFRVKIDGKIIAYCCDTAICENDLKLANKADILIHECSFLSGMKSFWGHSTPEEAAQLAKKAKVKKLFLTHFSPNLFPTLKSRHHAAQTAGKIFKNTFAAVDGKSVFL